MHEVEIQGVVADVLGVDDGAVGPTDNFFDLGGDSLACVELFERIREVTGAQLPLSVILRSPTPRLLAREVSAVLEGATASPYYHVAPAPWDRLIAKEFSEALGRGDLSVDDDLVDAGTDPGVAAATIDRINRRYGARLTVDLLGECRTARALARATRPADDAVDGTDPGHHRGPFLFCIAGAAGTALAFYPLATVLSGLIPVVGLQSHGLEERGLPDYTLGQAARRFAREIRAIQPEGPYFVAGHSVGGVVALKVADELRRRGGEVALLAILDTWLNRRLNGQTVATLAPRVPRRPWGRDVHRPSLGVLVRMPLAGVVRWRDTRHYEAFRWIGVIQSRLVRRLPVWRGAAVVYQSRDDESVDMRPSFSRVLHGEWECVPVPGSHSEILAQPWVADLGRDLFARIRASLERAGEPVPGPAAPGGSAG